MRRALISAEKGTLRWRALCCAGLLRWSAALAAEGRRPVVLAARVALAAHG